MSELSFPSFTVEHKRDLRTTLAGLVEIKFGKCLAGPVHLDDGSIERSTPLWRNPQEGFGFHLTRVRSTDGRITTSIIDFERRQRIKKKTGPSHYEIDSGGQVWNTDTGKVLRLRDRLSLWGRMALAHGTPKY